MQMLSARKIFFHLNEILKKILDNSAFLRYNIHARRDAGIAQSVEQLICNQQVGGSSPSTSSIVATSYGSSHFRASAKIRSLRCGSSSSRKRFAGFRSEKRKREHKLNMGEFPSGQRGQTVNLLAMPSVVRIHLPPLTVRKEPFICFSAKAESLPLAGWSSW